MCNRNVGGSSRYLVSCFQQYFWENIFKFLIYERRWSLLCFPIFKFSINPYVFLIFKVSVTQSATWVIFTELIWTSLIQIYISSTIVVISGRLISERINWMLQYNVFVEDQVLFAAKGGEQWSGWTQILRVVGRGSLLSLSHGQELFQKSTEVSYKKKFQDKSSVGNTFPEKNGWIKSNKTGKKLYARLRTVRVCCVNQPPV